MRINHRNKANRSSGRHGTTRSLQQTVSLLAAALTVAVSACTPPAPPDTEPPVLSLPGTLTTEATSASGATVTFVATAVDAVAGVVPVSCSPDSGSLFPVGVTTVACSASDPAGNTASGTFNVEVTEPVDALAGATRLTAGYHHTCAIVENGEVVCWGADRRDDSDPSLVPEFVPEITGATDIDASSSNTTCVILTDGHLECWGRNDFGQLGNGTISGLFDSNPPSPVTAISAATDVSVGLYHVCAVLDDGGVQCWGRNSNGQLGDGTTDNSAVPVAVPGVVNAVAVAAEESSTCALLADGTVTCWGLILNSSGWYDQVTAPALNSDITGATDIHAGSGGTMCVLTDIGAVKCWGKNSPGTLGDGTTVDSVTPVMPTGVSNATTITSGNAHSCAVISGGTVKCWGSNQWGELGNGTTTTWTTPNLPAHVSGITTATAVATGAAHSCALLSDSTIRCWGYNGAGGLGNGTTNDSTTPVTVLNAPA